MKLLVCVTGSVASVKLSKLCQALQDKNDTAPFLKASYTSSEQEGGSPCRSSPCLSRNTDIFKIVSARARDKDRCDRVCTTFFWRQDAWPADFTRSGRMDSWVKNVLNIMKCCQTPLFHRKQNNTISMNNLKKTWKKMTDPVLHIEVCILSMVLLRFIFVLCSFYF